MWSRLLSFAFSVHFLIVPTSFIGSPQTITTLHYASNSNFANGSFAPASAGYNLADVASVSDLSELPVGTRALVYLGLCGGASTAFVNAVEPFVGQPQVFGFYLMDDPDPTGEYGPACPPANLRAEADWIHDHDPGTMTFIVLMNLSSSTYPDYRHSYNPANTHVDLYGLDIYPCRTDVRGCAFSDITAAVRAAESSGVPNAAIVPIYQAFGGGSYLDDSGGLYAVPTPSQAKEMIRTWASLVPDPVFDYTYSWGSQAGDSALNANLPLQGVFDAHNVGTGGGYAFPLPRSKGHGF